MTQVISSTQQSAENQALECGVLQSITCINFMCHTKLQVDLGPNINFIIGHNGSGKSAVLTAITLCLGGKASSTNRGQSLKSFVKEGQETATLIVKIKNAGEGNYKHDIFGNTIIVERAFSITGASGFKIKNETGRIISTKRSYLDDISDFYALQLENPVNVLTQDMARQFLNSSTPSDKYRFFIKGVQLEQLDTDYTVLAENLTNIESKVDTMHDDHKHVLQAHKAAQAKLALTENISKLTEKAKQIDKQYCWIQVEHEERKLEKAERSIANAEEVIGRKEQAAHSFQEAYIAADKVEEDIQDAIKEVEDSCGPLRVRKAEADAFERDAYHNLEAFLAEQRDVHNALKATKAEVTKRQEEVQIEFDRLQTVNGGSEAEKLAEIQAVEDGLAQAKIRRDEHRDQKPALERQLKEATELAEKSLSPVEKAKRDLEESEKRLRNIQEGAPGDRAYHPSLSRVRRAIDQETRWRQQPVGPLGRHIKLNKSEWSSVIERTLGNSLNSFAVSNQEDQKRLTAIMHSSGYRGQVFIVTKDRIDTRGHEPEAHLDTILRVLEIDSDLARNSLIINQHIDQQILVPERQVLSNYMFSGQRVRNVKAGVCLTSDRSAGIRFSYGAGGAEKSDPVPRWTGSVRIETNVQDQIRMAHEMIAQQKQVYETALRTRRTLQESQQKCQQLLHRHSKDVKEYAIKCQRLDAKLQDLRAELEELLPQDGRLDGLKSMLEEAQANCQSYQDQFNGSEATRQEKQAAWERAKTSLPELELQLEGLNSKINDFRKKADKAIDRKHRTRRQHEQALHEVHEAQKDFDHELNKRSALREQVAEFTELATQAAGARVPIDRGMTLEILSKKKDEAARVVKQYEQEIGGSEEEITRKAREAHDMLRASKRNLKDVLDLMDQMTLSLDHRRRRWKLFRATISARARAHFVYLLSERGFKGHMGLDHKSKTLNLMIQPTEERGFKETQERQTKTLSGGEKSFTTICLLLSLWDAMGSPIRCLDEFDVFMDSVNRDISMRMMIMAARRSVGRQYILITPQAMGNVIMGPDVKVIRLGDPERGQTSLNFGQGT
ncbi:hypothetical protein FH972_022561 [Carpinus fangiana]|uniref:Rad50/SbcC-type AAA domain-containing protein n=1 Tax=Carpinus fangiana TaxID=176857 RepID=A0A5N6KT97_9ROSI|nr:hypothetical protein FH972_022561 [Carpinus fangiana]